MRFLSFHINNIPQMWNGKEIVQILTFFFHSHGFNIY